MYGLVNQALEDLVVKTADDSVWQSVKRTAGISLPGFVSMENYEDAITFDLAAAAGYELEMTQQELLRAFGKHWITFSASRGYGALLRMVGKDVPEFIANIDVLHARVGMSLPDMEPPSFRVSEESGGELIVRYYSERSGLTPMVIGVLEGLCEMLGTPYAVEQVTTTGKGCDHEVFRMRPSGCAS